MATKGIRVLLSDAILLEIESSYRFGQKTPNKYCQIKAESNEHINWKKHTSNIVTWYQFDNNKHINGKQEAGIILQLDIKLTAINR